LDSIAGPGGVAAKDSGALIRAARFWRICGRPGRRGREGAKGRFWRIVAKPRPSSLPRTGSAGADRRRTCIAEPVFLRRPGTVAASARHDHERTGFGLDQVRQRELPSYQELGNRAGIGRLYLPGGRLRWGILDKTLPGASFPKSAIG